jgi:hypothetical protein
MKDVLLVGLDPCPKAEKRIQFAEASDNNVKFG